MHHTDHDCDQAAEEYLTFTLCDRLTESESDFLSLDRQVSTAITHLHKLASTDDLPAADRKACRQAGKQLLAVSEALHEAYRLVRPLFAHASRAAAVADSETLLRPDWARAEDIDIPF